MATTPAHSVNEAALSAFDVARVRRDFPILEVRYKDRPIAYLDNAATTQKPNAVIDAIHRYYTKENANVHRGVHYLSQVATDRYEEARDRIARFIGSPVGCQILFTRGTTEGINLVAQTWGREHIGPDDEVLITHMEHHSNIVPWQMLCNDTGATLRIVPIHDDGALDMDALDDMLTERTKLVGVVQVSNALGTVNPVKEIAAKAHAVGARILVDGAQSVPHMPVNVQELDCDFFAFSGHKMYGPTGIGVLWGRIDLLESMGPYQGGGDMILSVSFEKTVYNHLPHKFEAGTPHIEGVIGLGAAVKYLEGVGIEAIAAHEKSLLDYGTRLLSAIPGVHLIGTAPDKAGVISFTMDSAHPHDIGQILNEEGVAVRVGHHCAQPVMQRFGVPATARASVGLYNTKQELDALAAAIEKVNEVFG
ncbi:MAG: SufS family cysteine desulfurase [Candidatus Hydrogenedentota bacterium]